MIYTTFTGGELQKPKAVLPLKTTSNTVTTTNAEERGIRLTLN